jgi:ribosomal protein L11 methyltransferase
VVTTTWHPVEPEAEEVIVVIDPGMAFGTAEHGTTRGCLRLLDRVTRPGDRVLDVGAGSGILSIAAARLGAREVLAFEGDSLAVEALADNVERNGVAEVVSWQARWVDAHTLMSLDPRDGIVANLEAGLLRPLLVGFAAALPVGGWLILSGILESGWDAFSREVLAVGFGLRESDRDGEWRSGVFVRIADEDRPPEGGPAADTRSG